MKQYKVYKTVTHQYVTTVEAETSEEAEQIARYTPDEDMTYAGVLDEDACAWLVSGERSKYENRY